MSLSLTLLLVAVLIWVVSQFGGKLSAKNAFIWWVIFGFLLFATTYPEGLAPIAHALGVTLVSNLVLAAMVLLISLQLIVESASTTVQARKFRELVAGLAAKESLLTPVHQKKILVVFPCYNEEENLPALFNEIKNQLLTNQNLSATPCIINDGSKDRSLALIENFIKESEKGTVLSASHLSNIGVAGVLLTGFKIAKKNDFDFLVQCDSDGQHPINKIPELVQKASELKSDLLIGSRYLDLKLYERHESSTFLRRFGSILIRATLKLFSSQSTVTDPTSGFRVYSKKAIQLLEREMPDEYPEPESVALLLSEGLSVREISVPMRPRGGGKSSISGLKSAEFMLKVVSALLGLRIRTMLKK